MSRAVTSPARILHGLAGAPAVDRCEPRDGRCYVCALPVERGMDVSRWMGSNFTDQMRCACPSSTVVCEACAWSCSWVAPPGFIVTDEMAAKKAAKRAEAAAKRAAEGKRPPGEEKGENLRLFSHLYSAGSYVYANKADKPTIRAFLTSEKRAPWFGAVSDTGQKHTVPFAPINLHSGHGGAVLFEDAVVQLPRSRDGWAVLDDTTRLLTAGATKDEITRGEYRPETWIRCRAEVQAFEAKHGHWRGGRLLDLVVWLAQRDEEAVAERQAVEKAAKSTKTAAKKAAAPKGAKHGKDQADGRAARKAADANSERAARAAGGLPRGRRKRDDALVSDRVAPSGVDSDECVSRGVDQRDEARASRGGY